MTDYTKEAEERIYPTYEQSGGGKNWDEMTELEQAYYNLRKAYNAFDVMKNTYLRVRQQSAAEIDRLRGEVERLKDLINTVAGDFFAAGIRRAKSKNPETLNLVDYKEYYFKQNNIQ